MIRFIFGRASSGKTTELLNEIKNEVFEGKRDVVLLVPEQTSFDYEKALLHTLGDGRFTSVPVLSFTRLVDEVGRKFGGISGKRVDDCKRTVLMGRAINACADRLTVFSKYASNANFIKNIVNTISELKRCGIDSVDMLSCANKINNSVLSHKLLDIDTISNTYEGIIKNTFIDPDDDMQYLAEQLSDYAYFAEKTVFVDSFKNFTGAQMKIIEQIIRQSDEAVFSFCYDENASGGVDLFSNVKNTVKSILQIAQKYEIDVKEPTILGESFYLSEELKMLERGFSVEEDVVYERETDKVTICAAQNMYDEAEFVANEIRRLVREKGYRYRDFVILARNDEQYRSAVEHMCRQYDIPCFTDKRYDVAYMPCAVFVSAALSAVMSFSSEDILRYLKTELCGVSFDEISALENYVYMWNIDRADWKNEWTMSPSGFEKFDDHDEKQLHSLNELRVRVINPLLKFKKDFCGTAENMSHAIWRLINECDVAEHLVALKKQVSEEDGTLFAQAYEAVLNVLDSLCDTLGEEPISPENYISYFNLALSGTQIGAIPQMLDEVVFGAADRIKPQKPRVVFVLGMNQGVFPAQVTSAGIIGMGERNRLLSAGLPITDYSLGFSVDEQYLVYTTLSSAAERVYVSYTETDSAGKPLKPSAVIDKILKIFPNANKTAYGAGTFSADRIETPAAAFTGLLRNLKNQPLLKTLGDIYLDMPEYKEKLHSITEHNSDKNKRLSPETSEKLFSKNMRLSATGIDTYFRCSFSYFCRYGLRAKVIKPAEIDVLQRGTIVHEVLEKLISKHGKQLSALGDEQIINETDIIVEEYLSRIKGIEQIRDNRFLHLVATIKKLTVDVVCHIRDDFAQNEFTPVKCELKIGGENADVEEALINTDKGSVRLQGAIDRVDRFGAYIRIVDYKTGSRKFNLSDVLYGLNMQMLIYLYAVMHSEKFKDCIPAGVLYLETSKHIGDENNFVMNGLISNNFDVHSAMERENEGKYVPRLRTKKDGTFYKSKEFISEDEFNEIFSHIEKMLKQMNRALLCGEISVNPTDGREKDACKYCDYASVCGIENRLHKKVPALSNESVIEMMGGEANV